MEPEVTDAMGELSLQKRAKTNAQRNKKYKDHLRHDDPEYKERERKRMAEFRAARKQDATEQEKQQARKKETDRKREYRRKKQAMQQTPGDMPERPKGNQGHVPYQRPQSLGKAVSKVIRHLPYYPRKKVAVMTGVAERIGIQLVTKMSKQIGPRSLSSETAEAVKNFYTNSSIVYTMPGMKDEMVVWTDGKKMKMRKYYLTVYLREAHAIFKELHPELPIGLSKFCSLRPKNVLLLHDTPADQCGCRIHDNFILRLQGLKITYDSYTFWDSVLCDQSLNSKCWQNECPDCANGVRLNTTVDMAAHVTWQEWEKENGDQKRLRFVSNEGCAGELLERVKEKFGETVCHINIKRIQAEQFRLDQQNSDARLLQMDFAMNYSCEYQDEVQSALWSRSSVTLFTAASMTKEGCKTYIIGSDTKEKNKDTVAVFVDYLYENCLIPDDATENVKEEIIWTDGPSSEFKNKFMMKLLQVLTAKYKRKFGWKYFATGHGKGVVDGVGGRSKSLVRQEVMSKKVPRTVVQSSEDFATTASHLMDKTAVFHISQTEIDDKIQGILCWEEAKAFPGIQKMHVAHCADDGKITLLDHALATEPQMDEMNVMPNPSASTATDAPVLVVGDWCVVMYDGKQFPGEVTNIVGGHYEISVMYRCGKYFYWPDEDNIFYRPRDIKITLLDHALATEPQMDEMNVMPNPSASTATDAPVLVVGDWCVVMYDGKQFPGEVTNIVGGHYEISVMYRCGKYFYWPDEDKIFYRPRDIVKKLQGSPSTVTYGRRILSEFEDFE